MRFLLTTIEKLDALHPGLRSEVDQMLAEGRVIREIRDWPREKYGVLIAPKTLWNYRTNRWVPSVRRVQRCAEIAQGFIKAMEQEGGGNFTFEQVFDRALGAYAVASELKRLNGQVEPGTSRKSLYATRRRELS